MRGPHPTPASRPLLLDAAWGATPPHDTGWARPLLWSVGLAVVVGLLVPSAAWRVVPVEAYTVRTVLPRPFVDQKPYHVAYAAREDVPRPRNAWLLFADAQRQEAAKNPAAPKPTFKTLSAVWASLDEDARAPYFVLAEKEKRRVTQTRSTERPPDPAQAEPRTAKSAAPAPKAPATTRRRKKAEEEVEPAVVIAPPPKSPIRSRGAPRTAAAPDISLGEAPPERLPGKPKARATPKTKAAAADKDDDEGSKPLAGSSRDLGPSAKAKPKGKATPKKGPANYEDEGDFTGVLGSPPDPAPKTPQKKPKVRATPKKKGRDDDDDDESDFRALFGPSPDVDPNDTSPKEVIFRFDARLNSQAAHTNSPLHPAPLQSSAWALRTLWAAGAATLAVLGAAALAGFRRPDHQLVLEA